MRTDLDIETLETQVSYHRLDIFQVQCPYCFFFHPFYFGRNHIVFLEPSMRKKLDLLAKALGVTEDGLRDDRIFVCSCGTPLKIETEL